MKPLNTPGIPATPGTSAAAGPHASAPPVTRNACKLCAPLGAALVFRGISRCIPLLHGSQGCATYIRRYLISHFREPVDIASSSFTESAAVFGGRDTLHLALRNIIVQYQPEVIGVATTCLAETIGDDVRAYLEEFRRAQAGPALPIIVPVSTPSYAGTHVTGFHAATRAVVEALCSAESTPASTPSATVRVNLLPGMVSPEDLRCLKAVAHDFGVTLTLLPDYSETLDGSTWDDYHVIAPGGATRADLATMKSAAATIEFSAVADPVATAGGLLAQRHGVPHYLLSTPIGVRRTDAFIAVLEKITGRPAPASYAPQRGRLLDSFIDGHKHVFGVRAAVYGDADLVIGITALLAEIGVTPVLCATGERPPGFAAALRTAAPRCVDHMTILDNADFVSIEERIAQFQPNLLIGSSKGYSLARRLDIPLVRVGFPVHDRLGGARLLHLGYGGAQQLFDRIGNTILAACQRRSPVGYTYM